MHDTILNHQSLTWLTQVEVDVMNEVERVVVSLPKGLQRTTHCPTDPQYLSFHAHTFHFKALCGRRPQDISSAVRRLHHQVCCISLSLACTPHSCFVHSLQRCKKWRGASCCCLACGWVGGREREGGREGVRGEMKKDGEQVRGRISLMYTYIVTRAERGRR